jgi:uncharacterized SAM-binding protein YcdF (DUF218 family)
MLEELHFIITYLLNPYPHLALYSILILSKFNVWSSAKRKLHSVMFISILYLFSTPLPSYILVSILEDQNPPLEVSELDPSKEYHILILGGGYGYDKRLAPTMLLSEHTLGRLVEGIRIFQYLPKAKIITSGNSNQNKTPQAVLIKNAAVSLGVSKNKIYTQEKPWNTQTEADEYVLNFGTDHPLILVSSATHLPRAILWFKAKGIKKILPAPTNFQFKKDNDLTWKAALPHADHFSIFQKALKEFIGSMVIKFKTTHR